MNISVDQEVIVVGIGNNARYTTPIHKALVSKLGRKWFEIITPEMPYIGERLKFSLEDGKNDGKGFMSEWEIFESLQVYNEYIERPELLKQAKDSLNSLSNQQLKIIIEKYTV